MVTQQHSTAVLREKGVLFQGLQWCILRCTIRFERTVAGVAVLAVMLGVAPFAGAVSAAQTGPDSPSLYIAQYLSEAPAQTRRLSNDPKAVALALFSALKRSDQPESYLDRLGHLVRLYRFDCVRVSDFQVYASSQNRIDLKVKCSGRPLYGVTVASNGYSAVFGGNGLVAPLDRRDGLIFSFSEEGQSVRTSRRTVGALTADTQARLVGTSSAAYYVYIGLLVVIVGVMGLLAVYWLQRYLIVYRRRRYLRLLRKRRSAARTQAAALELAAAEDASRLHNIPPNIDDGDYGESVLDFDRGDGWAEGQLGFEAEEGAAAATIEQTQAERRKASSATSSPNGNADVSNASAPSAPAPALKSPRRTYLQTAPSARTSPHSGLQPVLGEMSSEVKTRLQMEARPVHANLWHHDAVNVYIARGPRGKRRFFARRLWAELYCRYGIRMFEMYQVKGLGLS